MNSKFFIAKISPISRGYNSTRSESIIEILDASNDVEERDEFIRRYLGEPLPAPPAPKPVAPVIEPILTDDVRFSHESAAAAASAKPLWADTFQPRWLELSAAETLAELFEPENIVHVSSALVDAVEPFDKLAKRLQGFNKICINPIASSQVRAPIRRQSLVIVFNGPNDLTTQLQRAMYLGRLIPLELGVYVPSKMEIEFWYDVRDATSDALKEFAHEALRLGAATRTLAPNYMARVPASIDSHPTFASAEALSAIGIQHTGSAYMVGSPCLVLYKREKRRANKQSEKSRSSQKGKPDGKSIVHTTA